MKKVLIIDGQGGGMGRQLTAALKSSGLPVEITAVGTNAMATAAMLKAGADQGATGENAVITCCRRADIIIGPIGIVIADALLGEVTPRMATAVGQSAAIRILVPSGHCDNRIAGMEEQPLGRLVESAVRMAKEAIESEKS